MRSQYFHIIVSILLILLGNRVHAQFGENFNSSTVGQLENNCWDFDGAGISGSSHLNGGGNAPHAHANVFAILIWGSSPSVSTPYYYFNGSTTIRFRHQLDGTLGWWTSGSARVYLVDPTGNEVQIYQRNARFGPTNLTINPPQAGYYRIRWRWGAFGLYANLDGGVDDFTTSATLPPPVVENDVVCRGDIATYSPNGVVPPGPDDFAYTWSWVGPAGGTITPQTGNNRRARVDWTGAAGTYRLQVTETYDNGNCNGRIFYIDVTVRAQPTYTATVNTVCRGYRPTLTFTGVTGTAPYTVTINDGSGNVTFTTTGSTENRLLTADATSVNIISVRDANGCDVDAATLGSIPIPYYPKPATGPVYHY